LEKPTKEVDRPTNRYTSGVAGKRTYNDRCGVARALDVVGERWALLVVRELLLGPKRFTDLRAGLPGISPDVLAQRLKELEESGVVARRKLPPPAASRVYELTERGEELEPILIQLGRWGSVAPMPEGEPRMNADALLLALKTEFSPGRAGDRSLGVELRLNGEDYGVHIAHGGIYTRRGPTAHSDATIETDPATLAQVLWHGRSLAKAERSGDLKVSGSRQAVKRFLGLFPLVPV
jgi:DNA-binding HxlR family transcriptional regulator